MPISRRNLLSTAGLTAAGLAVLGYDVAVGSPTAEGGQPMARKLKPAPTPTPTPTPTPEPTGTYDEQVIAAQPVLYVPRDLDLVANHNVTTTSMPNGDSADLFDGSSSYLEVADADNLSITGTGILTIEAWIRPDTLDMPGYEAEGYVHWLGKGEPNQHEYVLRMYNQTLGQDPAAPRPNRISGYAFKLIGGQGAGSYFQDPIAVGQWIHVGLVLDNLHKDKQGYGVVKIYRDGVLRDTDSMGSSYHIVPGNGTAPLRIGTRDFGSWFKGGIGKVALYGYDASSHFAAHVSAMK